MFTRSVSKMQRYIGIFGRVLLPNSLPQWSAPLGNCFYFHGKNNIRYYNNAIEKYKGPDRVSTKKVQNINELLQYINNGKHFYLKQLVNVFHTIDFEKIKSDEAMLLLKCCGSIVVDSSRERRNNVCQDIFKGLQSNKNIDIGIFNRYVKTCTENNIHIYNKALMLNCEPNKETYKLLLENVCQFGKIEDAFAILEIMKAKEIALDNDSVNNIILAHTLRGGLKSTTAALNTIRSAQISENNLAKLAIFKGLIRRKDLEEFKMAVKSYPISLSGQELLDFIEELGLNGLESWLIEVHNFYKHLSITRDLQIAIERVCVHLVHMNQPMSAMNFYETFVESYPDMPYGYALLKEMLHCNIDITTIISLANNLVKKELNPYILESLTQLALKFKYEEQAWALLGTLQTVRPHYFWPLLVHCGKSYGENGVMSALKRINNDFNVKLDTETLEQYILPYCNLSDLKLLILKLQGIGFNVREILSPLLMVLMRQKKTRDASELCRLYKVNVTGEGFLELLARSWAFRKDSSSILTLLARYCESNNFDRDFVGGFLIDSAKFCELKDDLQAYLTLIKTIGKSRLKISAHSADLIKELCDPFTDSDTKIQLNNSIHSLVDFGLVIAEDAPIPHPKSMDLDGLEGHLIELQEKNMDTRGVLRKLIQMHASKGSTERVRELRQQFLKLGYEESPGLKSSVMHSYALGGQLEEAMGLYHEIKTLHPEFHLDNFKFIDLVKLLIDNDRFDEGYLILQEEISKCKRTGNTRSIERNCKNLLSACKNAEHVDKVFNLLSQNSLCRPSNVILGPLVKIHLKSGDINKAVEKYIELSRTHKCTPLQLEVFCAVANGENTGQLEDVLKATEAVHGLAAAQLGLIAALAENGQEKALQKTLIKCTSPSVQQLLETRCKRWIEERKIEPLKCLANACTRLPPMCVNIDFIYKCVFDIYDLNGDCEAALALFDSLPEDRKSIQLEQELHKICDRNKTTRMSNNMKVAKTF